MLRKLAEMDVRLNGAMGGGGGTITGLEDTKDGEEEKDAMDDEDEDDVPVDEAAELPALDE